MAQDWKRIIFLAGAACAIVLASVAVPAGARAGPGNRGREPQSSSRSEKEQMLYVWKLSTQGIIEMAETLPEDKYDLRPQLPAEMSHGERVPTFVEMALAAASSVYYARAMLEGTKLPEGLPKHEDFKSKADIVAYIKKAFAEGTVLLENADFSKPVQGPEGPISGHQFWNDFVEGPADIHVMLLGHYREMGWALPPGEVAAASAASREIPDRIVRLTSECEKGKYASCTELGTLYTNTGGVEGEARAAALYERACNGGDAVGCYHRGLDFVYGGAGRKDESQAAGYFQRACDGGNAEGCDSLGRLYEEGRGVAPDLARAAELYQRACDGGDQGSCVGLGNMYRDGKGVTKDESRAADLYRRTCYGGYILSCGLLGDLYADGRGVAKDDALAAELYLKGCVTIQGPYCRKLARMYADGRGLPKDEGTTVDLLKRACKSGNRSACYLLGGMYEAGYVVHKDDSQAQMYYLLTCEFTLAGEAAGACKRLAATYTEARASKDEARAAELYRNACQGGFYAACDKLKKPQK